MVDIHNHSSFSADCTVPTEEMLLAAIDRGCTVFGISEHFDYDCLAEGITDEKIDTAGYFACASALKQKYRDKIRFVIGAEFGYHPRANELYQKTEEEFAFDYVVNSVHVTDGLDCYFQPYFEGKTKDFAYRRYLETVLESLSAPYDWQIAAHIGYVARNAPYPDPKLYYCEYASLLDEILRTVIRLEKALEVNTNVKTCGYPTIVHRELLERYYALGGRLVSFGADAHQPSRIGENYALATAMLREIGFTELSWFENRQRRQEAL